MATLTRPSDSKITNHESPSLIESTDADLSTTVPAPFPQLQRTEAPVEATPPPEQIIYGEESQNTNQRIMEVKTRPGLHPEIEIEKANVESAVSVLPSISQVENSCLITLNTLLSNARPHFQWQPVVPPRRHSMPNPSVTMVQASTSQGMVNADTSSALQTVLANLRSLPGEEQGMVQLNPVLGDNRNALINELQTRVHAIAVTLDESDAHLVISLVSLLSHAERLAQLQQPGLLSQPDDGQYDTAEWHEPHRSSIFDTLDRQLSHLKARRADEEGDLTDGEGPVAARRKVERTLLWDRIDEDLEEVSRLCRLRMMAIDPFSDAAEEAHHVMSPSLPPEYDPADFEPPEYRMSYDYPRHLAGEREKEARHKLSVEKSDHRSPLSAGSTTQDEKMRLDFEAVTMAIDRLYLVAPQLHNQRVELKKKKVEELERASKAVDGSTSLKNLNGLSSAQRSRSGSSAELAGDGLERKRTQTRGKGKQAVRDDLSELDNMLSLIGKASSRRMNDQAVVMSDEMKHRLQIARRRDDENRRKFVEQLASHSDAGRLHNQDAILPPGPRLKDPEVLLTLPEFIKEAVPRGVQTQDDWLEDPHALLTLPEFVKETHQMNVGDEQVGSHGMGERTKSIEGSDAGHDSPRESRSKRGATKSGTRMRSKSVSSASAAAGAWLMGRPWNRQSVPAVPIIASSKAPSLQAGLNVSFVAEYQDNLNAVTILLKINNPDKKASPPKQLIVEVVPTSGARADPSTPSETGDRILVKHKANWSTPLLLPTPVMLGKFTVDCSGEHYEIKLATPPAAIASDPAAAVILPQSDNNSNAGENAAATLDATHLTDIAPSTFVCASCSLPFVQSSSTTTATKPQSPFADSAEADVEGEGEGSGVGALSYRDLPSEHWAELLDAWMCHHDQKLADRITQSAKEGFWPAKGECLVGGSYLLLEESSVVVANLRETDAKVGAIGLSTFSFSSFLSFPPVGDGSGGGGMGREDEWKHVRCLCGASAGRSQRSPMTNTMVYRLPKYSIRPVAVNARALRIPMSAYVVEDMIELSQAHATYRFIVCDEEDEKPRLLLWLFKPSMKLSYSTPTFYLIPRSGSITAAKMLFKIIGPSGTVAYDLKTTLEKHRNFAQAEQLFYPLDICRRLAGLLKESHSTYPSNRRTMSGLDAGWLQRSS